jgi:sulfate transport system permease protein
VLIGIALAFLALILYIPAINVFYQAFHKGVGPFLHNLQEPNFQRAVWMTLTLAAIAVPFNTIFGLCAAWSLANKRFRGRTLLLSIIDLPFAISPVVAGLMIMLLYGRQGWFGNWLLDHDIRIVFGLPAMVLATAFVSMPFVAREVIPVLEEEGTDQEQAAYTLGATPWQTFWRVTVPNIRWGLMYGVLLTNARAMGEFGAVAVVSGNIIGKTQSLPLFVEEAYKNYDTEAAYSAAVLLALLAIVTLVLKEILERRTGGHLKKIH